MKRYEGFTLIELVAVIVILGIVAVTAVPKLLNLQNDARIATLNGMGAAINDAVGITYGKLAIRGLERANNITSETNPDLIPSCGTDPGDLATFCSFDYGYPSADFGTLPNLVEGISATPGEEDWLIKGMEASADATGILYSVKVIPSFNVTQAGVMKNDNCYVLYSQWANRFDLTVPVPPPTVEVVECN